MTKNEASFLSVNSLRGQYLHIPDLRPAFASWKQGVNPFHAQVKQAVDCRLEGLIDNERVLAKVKAADLGLFASGYVIRFYILRGISSGLLIRA
jgi:hypothetical protein